jgi:hypothetical protein
MVGNLVQRITGPNCPAGAKENLHVALAERDAFPHHDRQESKHQKNDHDDDGEVAQARLRDGVDRKNALAHGGLAYAEQFGR